MPSCSGAGRADARRRRDRRPVAALRAGRAARRRGPRPALPRPRHRRRRPARAIVPAACEASARSPKRASPIALCGSRRKASARPPTHLPAPSRRRSRERARRSSARFATPSSARSRCARRPKAAAARAARAGRRDRGDRVRHRALLERFQLASGDDAGPLPLRCAARWVDGALRGAGFRRRGGRRRHHGARQRGPPARRRARRSRRDGAAGGRGAAATRAAARGRRAQARAESLAATAALMADARQSARQRAQERGDARAARLGRMAMGGGDGARLRLAGAGAGARIDPALGVAAGARRLGRRRLAGARAVAARRQPRASTLGARRRRPGTARRRLRPRRSPAPPCCALASLALARRRDRRSTRAAPAQAMSSRIGYAGLRARHRPRLAAAARPVGSRRIAGNRYLALYHQGHLWLGDAGASRSLLFLRRPLARGLAWLLSVGGEAARPGEPAPRPRRRRPSLLVCWRRSRRCSRFGLALANLRQLTSELGRVWLIVGAAWFFFLRAGPLAERLARSGRAGVSFLRYAWPLLFVVGVLVGGDGRHARHGAAPDRRLCASGAFLAASVAMWWHLPQRPASIARSRSRVGAVRRLDRRASRCGAVRARRVDSVTAEPAREPGRAVRVGQRPARAGRPGSSAPRRPRASASAPCRGAASRPSRGCSGVPAQIHSDYTFTAIVGVFGAARRLGRGRSAMRALAASADPPPRPRHARRAAPGRRRRPARQRRPGAAQLDRASPGSC